MSAPRHEQSFWWGWAQSAALGLAFPSTVCCGPQVQKAALALGGCRGFTAFSGALQTSRGWGEWGAPRPPHILRPVFAAVKTSLAVAELRFVKELQEGL